MSENDNLNLWGQPFSGGRVPTVHNFTKVISLYRDFRTAYPCNSIIVDFRNWLENTHNFNENNAIASCYPLGPKEMFIANLSDDEIKILVDQPTGTLSRDFLKKWQRCDVVEVLPKCIADVFIAGQMSKQGLVGKAATNQILQYGFSGTPNTSNAILSVGRSVGRHFGFLDKNNQTTAFFDEYFN
mgnify:FL=1